MNVRGLSKNAEKCYMQSEVKQGGGIQDIKVEVLLNPKVRPRWNIPKSQATDYVLVGTGASTCRQTPDTINHAPRQLTLLVVAAAGELPLEPICVLPIQRRSCATLVQQHDLQAHDDCATWHSYHNYSFSWVHIHSLLVAGR